MTRPREGRNMKEENRDRQIPTPTLKRAKRMVFDKEGREWHLK